MYVFEWCRFQIDYNNINGIGLKRNSECLLVNPTQNHSVKLSLIISDCGVMYNNACIELVIKSFSSADVTGSA